MILIGVLTGVKTGSPVNAVTGALPPNVLKVVGWVYIVPAVLIQVIISRSNQARLIMHTVLLVNTYLQPLLCRSSIDSMLYRQYAVVK